MQDLQYPDDDTEPFGIENLLELASQIKGLEESELGHSRRLLFFRNALNSYYYSSCGPLETCVGDILYLLSDLIPEEERRRIHITPDKGGNAITDPEENIVYGFTAWVSLEDWRKEWGYFLRLPLPELSELLEPAQENYLKDF